MTAPDTTPAPSPTRTATLGGMLLASHDPARLREWYVAALGVTATRTPGEPSYDVLDCGGFYLMLDSRDDVEETNPDPARVILNFEVDDAQATAERIEHAGTSWVAPLEDRDGSWFATGTDPDGNYVQIISLSDEAMAAMQ
jgi:predicted enzyme related to lactoylglutathione lyase